MTATADVNVQLTVNAVMEAVHALEERDRSVDPATGIMLTQAWLSNPRAVVEEICAEIADAIGDNQSTVYQTVLETARLEAGRQFGSIGWPDMLRAALAYHEEMRGAE